MSKFETFAMANALPAFTAGERMQYVQITLAGPTLARDGRYFNFEDLPGIVERTMRYAGSTDLVVDFDHQTDRAAKNGKFAPAAGWIKRLDARRDGIWGLVEWTATAAKMIAGKEYRYISPVLNLDKQHRVLFIPRISLVNSPALEMTALASAQLGDTDMKNIAAALELPETATEAQAVAAILALKGRSAPTELENTAMLGFQELATGLAQERLEMLRSQQEAKVDDAIAAGIITPALRDWGVKLACANPASFQTFCSNAGAPFAHLQRTAFTDEMLAANRLEALKTGPLPSDPERERLARQLGIDPKALE